MAEVGFVYNLQLIAACTRVVLFAKFIVVLLTIYLQISFKLIIVQGPPNDAATGFPAGWRAAQAKVVSPFAAEAETAEPLLEESASPPVSEAARIAALPWGHLLAHQY